MTTLRTDHDDFPEVNMWKSAQIDEFISAENARVVENRMSKSHEEWCVHAETAEKFNRRAEIRWFISFATEGVLLLVITVAIIWKVG